MSDNLNVTTSTRGGLFSGFEAQCGGGRELLPEHLRGRGRRRPAGSGARSAGATSSLTYSTKANCTWSAAPIWPLRQTWRCNSNFQGLRGLFNEGLFILRASGTGTLFFNSYGDIEEVAVNGSYVVDNGHAVAWEPTLEYELTKARRIRSFLFSDQLLMRFHGQGRCGCSRAILALSPTGFIPTGRRSRRGSTSPPMVPPLRRGAAGPGLRLPPQ